MRWIVPVALGLTGCSLLYNPDDLPAGDRDGGVDSDVLADAPIDLDPAAFALANVYPSILFEGQGAGGSRRATLLIRGQNITADAKVTVAARTGPAINAMVHDADTVRSEDGRAIAVSLSIPVDPTRGAGVSVGVDLTIAQTGPDGPQTAKLEMLSFEYLDELTGDAALAPGSYRYSQVDVASLAATARTGPLQIRATSSIRVAGGIDVSATGTTPGPGGNGGGGGGAILGGAGATGAGPGGGKPSGGGGGFALRGGDGATANTGGAIAGDIGIANLDTNRSSGGAGGNGGALAVGGNGGAGGGALELSAHGDLTLAAVDADGGNGGSGATSGGGGSGGTILLRSGGTAVLAGTLSAAGGSGDGAGSVGRIRLDNPQAMVAATATPPVYRGPHLLASTPLVTAEPRPTLTVVGEKLRSFRYYWSNEDGSGLRGPFTAQFGMLGQNTFQLAEALFAGGNVLCVEVEGADFALQRAEARNCVVLMHVP